MFLFAFGKVNGDVAFFIFGCAYADFARWFLYSSAPDVFVDFFGDGKGWWFFVFFFGAAGNLHVLNDVCANHVHGSG